MTETNHNPPCCFVSGGRLLTDKGEVAVETLSPGDRVIVLAGSKRQQEAVRWIGRRSIDLASHPRPETVAPIRIQRGAFADNMPRRDLLLSPDHAVFVDGKLISARQLVNMTTIRQQMHPAVVEYVHVEVHGHAILLADGLPAESYLDTGNRNFFGNQDGPMLLHPDLLDEAGNATREAASCAPFVWRENDVRPVWQRLAERAAALGQPVPAPASTPDPDLRVIAQGKTLRPVNAADGLYRFLLPKGLTQVRIVSRAAAPTDTAPWLEDRRRLGVYAERITLRGADYLQDVPVDHPDLVSGWWAVERNDSALRRWTDGDALLPLPVMQGPLELELRASSSGLVYPLQGDARRQAA